MDQFVAMPSGDDSGQITVFELGKEEESGLELASSRGGAGARARVSFEEALDSVRPALLKLTALVSDLAPQEAEIEFGLKIGGETGIIVAKGTTEANFAVKLVWKRAEPDADPA